MKAKNRKRSQIITGALLVLAVAALMFGGIGGARAVLTPSESYTADIATQNAALQINENKTPVAEGSELLPGLPDNINVGQLYEETITVTNTGTIDPYVRVSVQKYWTEDGKRTDLDPALIKLETGGDWAIDEEASTPERTVLYYTDVLPAGETTTPVVTKIGVDGKVATMATQTSEVSGDYTTFTTTYDYNDLSFNLEVSADGIQDHNAKDAAISAWGVDASQFIPGM